MCKFHSRSIGNLPKPLRINTTLLNIVYVIESDLKGVLSTTVFGPKSRASEVRARKGFRHKQRVNKTPCKALSMS